MYNEMKQWHSYKNNNPKSEIFGPKQKSPFNSLHSKGKKNISE